MDRFIFMSRLAYKLLCLIVLTLQALSVGELARGATLCIHPDGEARVETPAELAACHESQESTDGVAFGERSCSDTPFGSAQARLASTTSRVALRDVSQLPVEVPPILAAMLPSPSTNAWLTRRVERSRTLPDERTSLASIILVV